MPLPQARRPFTTSSLTSTLKSTIASQPLLGNTIDKLSSQANSFAQKSSIFGALNQQFQQINQQLDPNSTNNQSKNQQTTSEQKASTNPGVGAQNQQQSSSGGLASSNSNNNSNNSNNNNSTNKPADPNMTTPTVDMSHLTEEERLMIQSVMAKAEMADMGMPVDTSLPSSTNLPSQTSRALTQQRSQQQQQQQQRQQQQHMNLQQNQNNPQGQQMNFQQIQNQSQLQQPQQMLYQSQNQNLTNQQPMQQTSVQMNQFQQQQTQGPAHQMNPSSTNTNLQQQHQMNNMLQGNDQMNNLMNNQLTNQMPNTSQSSQLDMNVYNTQQYNQQQNQQMNQQQPISTQQNFPQQSNQMNVGTQPQLQLQSQSVDMNPVQQQMAAQQFGQNLPQQQQQVSQSQVSSQISSVLDQYMPQISQTNSRQQAATSSNLAMAPSINQSFDSSNILSGQQPMIAMPLPSQQQQQPPQQQPQPQPQHQQIETINPFMQQQNFAQETVNAGQAIFGLNTQQKQQHLLQGTSVVNQANQQIPTNIQLNQQMDPAQFMQHMNQQQFMQPLQQNYLARNEADYDHSYSDHELHGPSSRYRLDDSKAIHKQQLSMEVSSSDWQHNIRNQNKQSMISRHYLPASKEMQAFDVAERHPLRSTPTGMRSQHKARKLPLQPGVSSGAMNRSGFAENTPQSSTEHLHSIGYENSSQRSKDTLASKQLRESKPTRTSSSSRREVVKQKSTTTRKIPAQKLRQHPKLSKRIKPEESITDSEPEEVEDEELEEEDDSLSLLESPRDRSSKSILSKQASISKKQATKIESSADEPASKPLDTSEKALQLLSELKLTEQANQVMEQQQQLIKQSQELIKLQQAQLDKQNELKSSNRDERPSMNKEKSAAEEEESRSNQADQSKNDGETATDRAEDQRLTKKSSNDSASIRNFEVAPTKKSITTNLKHEEELGEKQVSDTETESQRRRTSQERNATKSHRASPVSTTRGTNIDDDDYTFDSDRASRTGHLESNRNNATRTASTSTSNLPNTSNKHANNLHNSGTKSTHTYRSSHLSARHRDILQSPTDTTDSDIDLSANHKRAQRHHQSSTASSINRSKGIVRRREPTGLPPSPLPVAAAIQLHQMQQQHLKNQPNAPGNPRLPSAATSTMQNLSRTNFLRSRSVTSSPNHLLERANSGYLTDNQRTRPSSPDTMSEYGGQMRRRRRLPEPPSNTMPLTPSMVRKMIQAQKAAATSSNKLLTSINAQSTLLTNMHSTRNPSLDRLPNSNRRDTLDLLSTDQNPIDSRPITISSRTQPSVSFSRTLGSASNLKQHGPISYPSTSILHNRPTSATHALDNTIRQQSALSSTTNYNRISDYRRDPTRFSGSIDGRLMISNPIDITDIKETPELDKLISNLDDYYGRDSRKHATKFGTPSTISDMLPRSPQISSNSLSPRFNAHHMYPLGSNAPLTNQTPLTSSYLSKPSYRMSGPVSRLMTRRSSEGEVTDSLARLGLRDPLNLTDNFGGSSSYANNPYVTYGGRSMTPKLGHHVTGASSLTNRSLIYRDGYGFDPINHRQVVSLDEAFPLNATKPYRPYQVDPVDAMSGLSHTQHSLNPTFPAGMSSHNPDYMYQQQPSPFMDNKIPHQVGNMSTIYGPNGSMPYSNRQRQFEAPRNIGSYPLEHPQEPPASLRRYPDQQSLSSAYLDRSINLDTRGHRQADFSSSSMMGDPVRSRVSNLPYNENRNQNNYGQISRFAPLTKDDIINHGPKFNSIGYRFGTENQNKYVNEQQRVALECLQTRYPHPYKRILLSKNPKDRIGNGIGVQILGGQPLPNLYDKVNRCTINSGAFVSAVFQSGSAHFANELSEGDQIIEWNGVNLCNRSDQEVQQILLSQFSDEEVEIVYLNRDNLSEAYGVNVLVSPNPGQIIPAQQVGAGVFEQYAKMNRSTNEARLQNRFNVEPIKDSLRRKLSLSSISHKWTR